MLTLVFLACQPRYLPSRPAPPPPPPPAAEPAPQRPVFYVGVGRLNLRAGPGMDFPKLIVLERNEEVEKVGEMEDWFQVRVKRDGSLGWVASRYLSSKPVPIPLEPTIPEAPAAEQPAVPESPKPETLTPRAPKPAEAAEPPAVKPPPVEPAPEAVPAPLPGKPAPPKEEPPAPEPEPPGEKPSRIRIM